MASPTRVLVVTGATAVGKTAVVSQLGRKLPIEVISADSVQVYRGMDIGTAKPTAEEQAEIPHRLIDIVSPGEEYNAGIHANRAWAAIAEASAHSAVPVVTGGTGFYLDLILRGMIPNSGSDAATRERVRAIIADDADWDTSLARLAAKDPRTAARIERNDIRRLSRSLEIVMESGGALTKAKVRERPLLPEYDFRSFFLCRPRDALALRIRARTRHMFLSNFCGEVRRLLDTEGFEESAAAQAVGYRQVVHAFRHNSLHKVLAQPWIYEGRWQTKVVHNLFCDVQTTTRRLARRQFNWFRGDDAFSWIDIEANDPRQVVEWLAEAATMSREDFEADPKWADLNAAAREASREGLASKDATHLDRPLGDQTVRHIVNAYQRSHPEIRGKPQFEF